MILLFGVSFRSSGMRCVSLYSAAVELSLAGVGHVGAFGRHVGGVAASGLRVVRRSKTATAVAAVVVGGGVVGALSNPTLATAFTWPTGLEPNTLIGLFTAPIYDAIPVVVTMMATISGIWFAIWTVHSFATRKG